MADEAKTRTQHFNESIQKEQGGPYTIHTLSADHPNKMGGPDDAHYQAVTPKGDVVGNMIVSPNRRFGGGNIEAVTVDNDHKRRGLATAMGSLARQNFGELHHTIRTGQGEAWAKAFDKKVQG